MADRSLLGRFGFCGKDPGFCDWRAPGAGGGGGSVVGSSNGTCTIPDTELVGGDLASSVGGGGLKLARGAGMEDCLARSSRLSRGRRWWLVGCKVVQVQGEPWLPVVHLGLQGRALSPQVRPWLPEEQVPRTLSDPPRGPLSPLSDPHMDLV